ncbi:unnamed protein product [Prorocentrum cordatum]|uniref:KIF-binding protein n=1 Tax=Prorocentrum cordatum TaxID=2364126 RepID=A0ABN9T6C5_9DINO|nr:unnamed protein product [Polarella glacialis]
MRPARDIETELLSAPTSLRAQSLNRDFTCACPRCLASPAADEGAGLRGREFLHVDAQVQANLSLLPPAERVEAVEAALRGEMGDDDEGEEEEGGPSGCAESGGSAVVLGKDAQELRVVQALALMQMQRWADALQVWRRLAAFACRHCPPFDEALVAYATQAALCALAAPAAADSASSACASAPAPRDYAAIAAAVHRVAFGTDLYRWRYRREVQDSVVPESVRASFWAMVELGGAVALPRAERVPATAPPLGSRHGGRAEGAAAVQPGAGSAGAAPWTWGSCDAAWRFEGHEVPEPAQHEGLKNAFTDGEDKDVEIHELADLAWAAAGPRLGEMHAHEVHAEVLDGQLLNVAVPGTEALGFQLPCAFPTDEGVEDECSGWPAPGIWQPLSPDAETRIFADGLEAGWRLAEQYLEHRGPSEKLRTQDASLVSSGGVVSFEELLFVLPLDLFARVIPILTAKIGVLARADIGIARAVHRRNPATSDPGPTATPSADASGTGPPQQADCQQQ